MQAYQGVSLMVGVTYRRNSLHEKAGYHEEHPAEVEPDWRR